MTAGDVTLIGLGAMGGAMARQMAGAGWTVQACDVDETRRRDLADIDGIRTVAPDELGPGGEVVVLMLPSSAVVDAVVLGPDGLLARMAPGATLIDMGSSNPHRTRAVAAAAAERGIGMLDAPVSGGVVRAQAGDLAVMVGGDAALLARWRPLLDTTASSIVHVGPIGAGHAMKALNNLLSAIGLLGACEVLAIGAQFGLAESTMLEGINSSTGRNHATDHKIAQHVLSRGFGARFALDLMVKDISTALALGGDDVTHTLPLASAAVASFAEAAGTAGFEGADHTEIARLVEQRLGLELTPRHFDPAGDDR